VTVAVVRPVDTIAPSVPFAGPVATANVSCCAGTSTSVAVSVIVSVVFSFIVGDWSAATGGSLTGPTVMVTTAIAKSPSASATR